MAICVTVKESVLLQEPLIDGLCHGFWLVTPEDKVTFLERIFDPAYLSQPEYETLFTLGISAPLICYVTAWAFGAVINFINSRD